MLTVLRIWTTFRLNAEATLCVAEMLTLTVIVGYQGFNLHFI